ncbi:hypothetical protein [Dyadobacter fanqingshengii]|uniref:Uncharacterized protein n=1 Tax=Dyadobacter fanqingshengii TaxID=2906443 RepID=A0A9X1TAC2_9BACT|nr:hypothetical protein [Dyadobacter fanqingshengii]MCF0041298.1 hypothetical protein [Dyadobacter fanqingshengii]MCF2505596.1 hypothetical protein [Dyadobacter fanqingshengii]USJ36978.1 hypothetical protein NFI81_04210 [Dyadobacter fanqingshengii]
METIKQKGTVFTEVNNKLDQVESMLMDFTNSKLVIMDKEYWLRDWMTLSDYCKKYNIKPSRLSNWMERGVVPAGSVIVIPELNGLKLIKDQAFMARSYKARAGIGAAF